MEAWKDFLAPDGITETTARIITTLFFFIWNVFEGSRFETPYPVEWISLYPFPYWRLFLVFITILACAWCPRVGVLVALALFFYIGDMFHLTQPWVKTQTQNSK